jgi:hypothetical protein
MSLTIFFVFAGNHGKKIAVIENEFGEVRSLGAVNAVGAQSILAVNLLAPALKIMQGFIKIVSCLNAGGWWTRVAQQLCS